ncbi:hypothetical protein O6H91_01G093800 [Diphasiastrum complanatum]|uniref:Uncharacterized protein n=3 Tax=Diphasiastrum complanatum TaxID=34168 RepID=A0ACC2ETT3_DIPCM|nr:hypothetical protein O6H91_01G093800 [Diphasiastrum complanatum]KAJ7569784.1 hypothetical protein O6H91_01G093800 [Diphasiastrum complanatum]KAJ7569785.1 hypothetical protein O6H91_01G093800 [Diphasiastrum complanatum]
MFGQIVFSVSVKDILLIGRDCNLAGQSDSGKRTLKYISPEERVFNRKSTFRRCRRQICVPENWNNNLLFLSKRNLILYPCSAHGGMRLPPLEADCLLDPFGTKAVLVHKLKPTKSHWELLQLLTMSESRSSRCRIRSVGMENSVSASVEQQADLDCLSTADVTSHASLPGINPNPLRDVGKSTNIVWQECMVKKEVREKHLRQKGCVVWITGLSGSGKSTLACTLDHALLRRGRLSYVLDGDNLRHGLNKNLGFSAEDRTENIRRVGEVAKLFADAGLICIASFISPYRKDRDACRKLLPKGDFIEVYLKVPLELCELRDPKGLYKLARAGKIKCFTGIDDPYEEPKNCEIVIEPIDGLLASPEEIAARVISFMEEKGYLQISK